MQLSDEQVTGNKDVIEKLIQTFPEERRKKVEEMFAGPIGMEYFTCPASTREDFHNCGPGGLADHSLRVTRNLRSLVKALVVGAYDVPTLNFVGLFHDFGKIGDGIEPGYRLLEGDQNRWKRQRGELYEINKKSVYMPSSERGLFILQKHGIVLSSDEYLAIRLNDGPYDPTNKNYAMREPDLALLTHMADRWACTQEKTSP